MEREIFESNLLYVNELVNNLQATTKKLAKESLLVSFENKEFLRRILLYTYNPYFVYGINKKTFENYPHSSGGKYSNIFEICDYLRRTTTINDDKIELNGFIISFPKELHYILRNIILKDLRCGIAIETINKVFPKLIPDFKVALCSPYEQESDIKFDAAIVQPKLDGVRCIALVSENGSVELYTRNGSKIEGYEDIEEELSNERWHGYTLDGEIMGDNFDNTMEELFAKGKRKNAIYTVFDIMKIEEFQSRYAIREYHERISLLQNIQSYQDQSVIKVIESTYIYDADINHENISKICKLEESRGYEGIVIKDSNSLYKFKRSNSWVKFKNMLTDEFIINNMFLGDGKYANTLGAIQIDVSGVDVKVGSGFSDEQREYIWENRDSIIGEVAEVKYQEITKDGSLRFPTFVKFRNDK